MNVDVFTVEACNAASNVALTFVAADTFVAPAAIQDLQAGDQILVCMADEGPAEALPQDTTVH